MNRPKIKENIDLAIIIDSVENYMDQELKKKYDDKSRRQN